MEILPVRTGWKRNTERRSFPASAARPATGLAVLLLILAGLTPLQAAPAAASEQVSPAPLPRFQTDLLPILRTHCLRCHNSEARLAGLDLSTEDAIFQGSASGSVLVPGRPRESPLYRMVHEGLMPPDQQTAPSPSEMDILRDWITSLPVPGSSEEPHASRAGVPTVTQQEVIPLMLLHCTACHGKRIQEAGLDLRTKAAMLKGGKSGPAIVPGKPEESLIVQRIRAREMPPSEREVEASLRPMSARGLEQLVHWISLGAPEVNGEDGDKENGSDPLVSEEDRRFWSFQPPRATVPPLPDSAEPSRLRNAVDAFIAARLREKGLRLSPEADRLTLIRRASFDLTGLPPEPEEVRRFLADPDPAAYEALIERLLDSPRYGERWGRHWLDLVGYSDRRHAWRYRDYVIRSLNAGKPYDRFLLEQLAGDELADLTGQPVLTREAMDNLIATGFLRMVNDVTGNRLTNFVSHRIQVISEQIQIFSSSLLGLTMSCARCHNHKFDPIPQRDYYRLAAVFKGAFDEHDWLPPAITDDPNRPMLAKETRELPFFTPMANPFRLHEESARRESHNGKINGEIESLQAALKQKAKPVEERFINLRLAELPEELRPDLREMLDTPPENRTPAQKELAGRYEQGLKIRFSDLEDIDPDYRKASEETAGKVKLLRAKLRPEPLIRALWDRGSPSPTYILRRGDPMSPGRWVEPGVPAVLTPGHSTLAITPPWEGAQKTGRRLALARWMVDPDHPLTARVMVNRIWKHHFGRGIVSTLGNFGRTGARPTHPELLDWLALEFIRQDWSLKAMHRLIMTSATYRQSSRVTPLNERLDPENLRLSRMPLRRMDAEVLRDTLFLISDRLDQAPGGLPDLVLQRKDGLATAVPTPRGWRRSIYITQQTSHRMGASNPTILDTFDFPEMTPNCLERVESTVVPQALHLLNDPTVRRLAESLAERVKREAGSDPARRIEQAYWIVLNRPPTSEEQSVSRQALEKLQKSVETAGEKKAAEQALAKFCHTLLNSAGFLYID
ncbi:MAG: PSD1 and planctomycete cytochrome C domain-containing protein [Acidobacteriota bacterium]|nr:PSD1 and planctomycete cytochrome C domain-containing protein [Acidobacteriota bacterium]